MEKKWFMEGRKKYAIIVAGGSGTRMGGDLPKQFINIGGKPILRHTIERFLSLSFPVGIIVVVNQEWKDYWKKYCNDYGFLERYAIPSGGVTRFHSVQNALQYLPDDSVVAVVSIIFTSKVPSKLTDAWLDSGIKPAFLVSHALQGVTLLLSHRGRIME